MPAVFPAANHSKKTMLVVDASVAVKFVAAEPDSDLAEPLILSSDLLVAPDWLLVEVGHALRRKQVEDGLGSADASRGVATVADFFDDLRPCRDLIAGAFLLSERLEHAIYDCIYLELALRESSILVTADTKFVSAARRAGMGQSVVLLADFAA